MQTFKVSGMHLKAFKILKGSLVSDLKEIMEITYVYLSILFFFLCAFHVTNNNTLSSETHVKRYELAT